MGQNNNGYRRPDFSGSKDFYTSPSSSLAPIPAAQPKSKTKLLIIVIIAAVILISIFAVIGTINNNSQNRQSLEETEFYLSLDKFRDDYVLYIDRYIDIFGEDENSEYNEYRFFIINNNAFEALLEQKKEIAEELKKMKETNISNSAYLTSNQQRNYQDMIEEIETNISIIDANIEFLDKFYVSFYKPLMLQFEAKSPNKTCPLNQEISDLLSSNNVQTALVAEQYKEIYCNYATNVSADSPRSLIVDLNQQNREKINSLSTSIESSMIPLDNELKVLEVIEKIKDERGIDE